MSRGRDGRADAPRRDAAPRSTARRKGSANRPAAVRSDAPRREPAKSRAKGNVRRAAPKAAAKVIPKAAAAATSVTPRKRATRTAAPARATPARAPARERGAAPLKGIWRVFGEPPAEQPKGRMELVLGLFMLGFAVLAVRAVDLAALQGDFLKQRAEGQHERRVTVPAHRGRILDRNGRTLAVSLPVHTLSADGGRVEDPQRLAKRLAPLVGVSREYLEKRLALAKPGAYPVLVRKLAPEVAARVAELEEPGLFFNPEVERFYPLGEVTAHVLGFVNVDGHGMEGLEQAFDEHLQGEPGLRVVSKDRLGRELTESRTVRPARPGTDLILTIDGTLQYIAYRALLKAVTQYRARAGTAVVMDPDNGEILALVNQPSFNPNDLAHSKPEHRRNRALMDAYEPGSTFKVFTVAAALDQGVVTPDTVIDCGNGRMRVKNRTIRDTKPHDRLTVTGVLQKSSNIGAARIGLMTGYESQERYLLAFGFGRPSGVEMDYEARGLIPDIFLYQEVGLANRSFGQGITTTPVQQVAAMSAVVNGGLLRTPRMLRAQRIEGKELVGERNPPERVIGEATSRALRRMLATVVQEGGTAPQARLPGYSVAGKTGTAQKASPKGGYYEDRYYASFLGFAPVEHPRLVVFVGLDEPEQKYYGGQVAAPAFREIMAEALPLLGVEPRGEEPLRLPPLRSARVESGSQWEGLGLETALERLRREEGVVPVVRGAGQVAERRQDGEGRVELVLR